jgi:outer membrane protein assembly factor BamB
MSKKIFLGLFLSVIFCFTSFATPYITLNTWSTADYQEHCSLQGINQTTGEVIWNTYLGSAVGTEVNAGDYLGINNGFAYVTFDGSVYMIDPETGNILLVNSDFQGRGPAWTFSSSGKLYMCGWYGPDLFIMGSDGQTISRVETLTNDQYFRPYSMYFTNGNNLAITYEGGRVVDGATLQFDVTKYFGIVERRY